MSSDPSDLPVVQSTGNIGGAMDGVRVPANQFELVKGIVVSQVNKYSNITKTVRPWKEFIILSKPPTSADVIIKKIQSNVTYYQSNYLMLVSGFMMLSLLTTPSVLVLFGIIGAGWAYLLKLNEDPNYMLVVAGVPLGKTQRMIAASLITGILILIFAGSLILSVLGMSAVGIACHAVVNDPPPASQIENIEEDDPINQI